MLLIRGRLITIKLSVVLVLLSVVEVRSADSEAAPPNVLIILTDDQGTLDARCYGSDDLHTPHIDELAARGVRFTQAYAHTVCCPARAMLLTGRYPQRVNVNNWTQGRPQEDGRNMFLDETTLAEALHDAGYATALFGKWHLGAAFSHGPTRQGFDEFFGIRGGFIDNYNHHMLHGNGFHDLYRGTEELFREGEFFPELVIEEAQEFLRENSERPFFLYLALNTPHYPEQYDEKYEEVYADLPMPRRSYAAFVSTTDDYIGRILDTLDELGVRDNTLITFMSDNGHSAESYRVRGENHSSGLPQGHNYGANGGGGNAGRWIGHKGTFLEGGIRVPFIVSFPQRLPSGEVRDQAVTAMDIYPTVLEICDVELPERELDGKSLLPVIESAEAPELHEVLHWQWGANWAVREGDWKLIVNRNGGSVFLGSLLGEEPEAENLAKQHPETVQRMTNLHERWLEDVTP